MTDGAIETVLGRTSQEEIRLVRFLYADHGGIIRGKAAGTARLRERMSSGIGHTVAMMAMSMLDHLQPVAGMGPVGEVRIVPDPETFVALPYAPGAGAAWTVWSPRTHPRCEGPAGRKPNAAARNVLPMGS